VSGASGVAPGAGASSSLELGTKLGSSCSVRIWPEAREASWYVKPRLRVPGSPKGGDPPGGGSGRASQELSPRSDERAARRAKAAVRRYCKANCISRHLTVTYKPGHERSSRGEVLRDVAAFRKRLFAEVGRRFPFVAVPERGSKNGRWHCEIGLGRYVPHKTLERLWGHGWVSVHRYSDRHKTSDEIKNASQVAGYLSKYVGKAFLETEREAGEHRYEVAQGFQPMSEVFDVRDLPEGELVAVCFFGGELPAFVWSSADVGGFQGLPVRCGFW